MKNAALQKNVYKDSVTTHVMNSLLVEWTQNAEWLVTTNNAVVLKGSLEIKM
jgi:hypothetical protein